MHEIEIVLGLLVLVALLSVVARRIGVPYPILMTVGGLVLGLVPGVPRVELPPEVVFLLFLPPILFAAAFLSSPRELRMNARPIGLLAIGLVLVTTVTVAVVVHALAPGMGWPSAFALGAIVSPPDAVAATSIAQRLGLPRRMVTILEGEGLVNDATALVALRLAVAAGVTGVLSLTAAAGAFVVVSVGGVVVGLAVGWAMIQVEKRLSDPPVQVLVSLLGAFGAWIAAESVNVTELLGVGTAAEPLRFSGVLAVVTAGLFVGRAAPRVMSSDTRILGSGVWQMVVFTLNGLVFILIGLQLPGILDAVSARREPGELALLAIAVSLTVVAVRMAWVFPATYLPRLLWPGLRARDPWPSPRAVVIIGWAGMRGIVSLAAALALPIAFPERDLVLFLTFVVIVATLVGQGLTLPALIRRLGIGDDGSTAHEEVHAQEASVAAALERLESLVEEWPGHLELIEQLRSRYDHAAEHLEHDHEAGEAAMDQEMIEHAAIRQAVIDAQRLAIIDLRDRGVIGDEALRRVERDLDLEELRAEG